MSRVLGVLGSALAALAAIELGVRLLGLAPAVKTAYAHYAADPVLPFRTEPGASFELVAPTAEFRHLVEHNSLGWRDVEHAREKPAGTFRIVGLGDSFTYGVGAPFEETFLARLEARLNARSDAQSGDVGPVEVLKAGQPRFFPLTERLMLEHYALDFDPDLVIVAFLPNDLMDTYIGVDAIAVDESGYLRSHAMSGLGRAGPLLYENSHAARLLLTRVARARERATQPEDPAAFWRDDGPYEAVWGAVEDELGRLVELARERGAEVVIAHVPHSRHYSRKLSPDEVEYPARRLARFTAEHGAHFVDLRPALWGEGPEGDLANYWPADGHCTPAGYDVIARELERVCVERGLVP